MNDSLIKPPRRRPALAYWLWLRGYSWSEAGVLFDCTGEAVRLWCLPFDDPGRRTPDRNSMPRILAATGGDITADDFVKASHVRTREDVQ